MVRKSPNREEATSSRVTKSGPRRAIAALVATIIIAMLWLGLAGYIWMLLIAAVIVIAILVYYVAAAATSPGTR